MTNAFDNHLQQEKGSRTAPANVACLPKKAIALSNKKGLDFTKSPAHCYDEM